MTPADETFAPLLELARAVAAELPLPETSRLALLAAVSLCGGDDAFLFAPRPGSAALHLRASHLGRASSPALLGHARDVALRCVRGRAPIEEAIPAPQAPGRVKASPILVGDRPLGCLVVARVGAGATVFGAVERRRLRAVADQVAAALQVGEAFAEQQRRVRELSLLSEVAAECAELGLDDLLPVVTRHVCKAVGHALAAVLFVDEPESGLVSGAVCTPEGPLDGTPARLPLGQGLAERALESRRPRRGLLQELGLPALEAIARARGLLHVVVVPMVVKDRAIGLTCAATRERSVTDDEVRLLSALTAEVAVAVENARLFAESQRRAADLELVRDVGQVIARSLEPSHILQEASRKLADALEVDAVRVYLRHGRSYRSAIHFGMPEEAASASARLAPDDPVVATALRSREPVASAVQEMPEPTRSFCLSMGIVRLAVAPLRVHGAHTGGEGDDLGLLVMGRRTARGFSSTELRVVAAVASQLAVALQNGRLYEATRKSVEDLSVVTEAGRALVGAASLDEALDGVAERLARLFAVRGGAVLLVDAPARVLRVAGRSAGLPASVRDRMVVPLDYDASVNEAVRTRRPVHRVGAISDEGTRWLVAEVGWFAQWAFSLPLMVGEQLVGVLLLLDDTRSAPLSEPDVERMRAISQQVAFAVDRARLNVALERSLVELAEAQAQLVRRERLAALGELAALVAHEVRNPLGAIVTSLGSLGKMVALEGDARRVYEILGEEARRLDRIVGDLLDYARPARPRPEPVALGRVLEQALVSARAGEASFGTDLGRVRTELAVGPGLGEVVLDERLVHQAVVNLLTNALQAVGRGGGLVRLEARRVAAGGRDVARIGVSDDGPGVAPEHVGRLFEPFFTTKARGSGLGLAVVKRIAEGHGGDVRVRTGQGAGAVFELDLPIGRPPAGVA